VPISPGQWNAKPQIFEQRFTSQQMASAYLSIYQKLAQERRDEDDSRFSPKAA
jgi:hypothetical protein